MSTRDEPGLSEHEQRALAEMAARAESDDPRWVARLRRSRPAPGGPAAPPRRAPASRLTGPALGLLGLLLSVLGCALAPATGWAVLGVLGLVVLTTGALTALKSERSLRTP